MNDVNSISSSSQGVNRTAPSKESVAPVESIDKAVKADLAEQQATAPEKKPEQPSPEDVEEALATMNEYVQSIQRDLQFSIDEELDTTVVKVIDSKSGELIRQIPNETLLELARSLEKDGYVRLLDASG